jgi:8-oxo-dGTP pyrophosphatase MutT (NUDIX family)
MTLQSAAIPFRRQEDGGLSVLLVTSRTRRRWILPKGKVGTRMLPRNSAAREAFEEAGVVGIMSNEPVGTYWVGDVLPPDTAGHIEVRAYALEVTDELPVWQEMHVRKRQWFDIKVALRTVDEAQIRSILRKFARDCR